MTKRWAAIRIVFFSSALLLVAVAPAAALSDGPYIAPGTFDVLHLLAPPPSPGSDAERKDIEAVVRMQQASTPERMRLAQEDAMTSLDRFASVLGPAFHPDKLPAVSAFFRKVDRERSFITNLAKDCWERPRPFVLDNRVHPPGTMQQDTLNRPGSRNIAPHDVESPCPPAIPTPAYSYSYPSGHSTFGATVAILLAQMVPEKRAELTSFGADAVALDIFDAESARRAMAGHDVVINLATHMLRVGEGANP